jgi:hypothetical protein
MIIAVYAVAQDNGHAVRDTRTVLEDIVCASQV